MVFFYIDYIILDIEKRLKIVFDDIMDFEILGLGGNDDFFVVKIVIKKEKKKDVSLFLSSCFFFY